MGRDGAAGVTSIRAVPVRDWDALGLRCGRLRRGPASFFQSWTWVGCLAAERYPDPVLIEARAGGETIGLALFNRRRFYKRSLSDGSVRLHWVEAGSAFHPSLVLHLVLSGLHRKQGAGQG